MPFKKKENRRKHPRIALCRLVKIQSADGLKNSEVSNINDLSETGMRFHVTDLSNKGFQLSVPSLESNASFSTAFLSLKKGDSLFFRIKLDPEHPEIATAGKIAWVSREELRGGRIRIKSGVEFSGLSDADRKLIQMYVAAFQDS